jgi:hypothetical protein
MKARWYGFLLVFALCAFSGCSTRSFGKATPPSSLLWRKSQHSQQMVQEAVMACSKQVGYIAGTDNLNRHDRCMLEKGFVFDDNVPGFASVCDFPTRKDLVGCKSMRGESYR